MMAVYEVLTAYTDKELHLKFQSSLVFAENADEAIRKGKLFFLANPPHSDVKEHNCVTGLSSKAQHGNIF